MAPAGRVTPTPQPKTNASRRTVPRPDNVIAALPAQQAAFPAERSVLFWMTRDDIVAQAYSFATAKLRGQWRTLAVSRWTKGEPEVG